MIQTPGITRVGFKPPRDPLLTVEAMTIVELRQRAPEQHFEKLQRADFYRLIGVHAGTTRPMLDFSDVDASAGDWLLVRPGQVFRYDFSRPWSGWMLVFRPDTLASADRSRAGLALDLLRRVENLPCHCTLACERHDWLTRSLQQMQDDGALSADVALRNELLRLQLTQTLLRLSMWQAQDPSAGTSGQPGWRTNFRRFRSLLERDFASRHQVQHYAQTLGMSDKTLSRVCLTATGLPAKKMIHQRLALEAKRLLAHTVTSVQGIGQELGFDEASNFVKFFRKETGMTPLAFRLHMANPPR